MLENIGDCRCRGNRFDGTLGQSSVVGWKGLQNRLNLTGFSMAYWYASITSMPSIHDERTGRIGRERLRRRGLTGTRPLPIMHRSFANDRRIQGVLGCHLPFNSRQI
ncbi:protein of unknown function [Nitrospira japonica]|uniref:Uncharacterized protein n=1 Tax=Nitrospira japonica TaxID=1325564 RepID=A0A1W1I3H9_9BACT|nr:protein of unknown function [Nitrospira japonica]